MQRWSDNISVLEKIKDVVNIFKNLVSSNPLIYPILLSFFDILWGKCSQSEYKWLSDLYEVGERGKETIVTLFLFLYQKQSIKEPLTNHCLLYLTIERLLSESREVCTLHLKERSNYVI